MRQPIRQNAYSAWQNPTGADPNADWFPVKITGSITFNGVQAYTASEWDLLGDGTQVVKAGGRQLTALNPGIPLVAGQTFSTSDIVLARPSFGAGGQLFQLAGLGNVASASFTYVSDVACTPSGGLIVTKSTATIRGTNLTITIS